MLRRRRSSHAIARSQSATGRTGAYLLTGLTVCAQCGYGFYGRTCPSGRRTSHAYYYCGASGRDPKKSLMAVGGCRNHSVRVDQLEAEVWKSVCALLQDPARVMQEWSHRADTKRARSEHDAQRADAAKLVRTHERALQRLVDAYEASAIDLPELTMRSERVRARMARAHDELSALEKVLAEQRELQLVVARVEDFAQRLRKGLDALSWEERRAIVRTVIARIEIADDDVTIIYRVPASGPTTTPPSEPTTTPVSGSTTTPPSGPTTTQLGGGPGKRDFVDCVQGVKTP